MAYPPTYERSFSFTDWEAANPGQPKPGSDLDSEFDDVSNALTATQDNLALIQRSDGALANDSVGEDQLQDGVFDGIADGITADAEAAAAAAAGSASAAASSAAAADASATAAATSAGTASGAAAMAGTSQSIAQNAANEAVISAGEAAVSADESEIAANETAGSVAACEGHVQRAFEWAELLTGPVLPAPPGWPEAVDDGMFSAKWWAIRARDYNEVHHIDLGTGGSNPAEAFDIWDAIPGNDLENPPGLVYATWGTPPRTYVLIDPFDPSDPNSWMDITGADGPPGPVGPQGPQGIQGPPGSAAFADPSALVGLTPVIGVAGFAIRADSAPALNQAIAPVWTGMHSFMNASTLFGTTAPLSVSGLTNAVQQFGLTAASAGHSMTIGGAHATGTQLSIAKTRSAAYDALTPVVNGDVLGGVGFVGSDGTTMVRSSLIWANVDGPVSAGVVPGAIHFETRSAAGAEGLRFTISSFGGLGIGGGNYGTAGQVFTSGGPAAPPSWANPAGGVSVANPTALLGLTAINGVATTAMRSDAAPALSQAIVPTWTGAHTFNALVNLAGPLQANSVDGISGQVLSSQGTGLPAVWRTPGGGAIEMGYNFNTSTAAANPGSQKLAYNNATFAGTTAMYINITAFTNFDASTILALLQAGNRIYMQQRNDASKAAIYQVTGPATNNTGWWTVPVTLVNSLGTPFPNNADLNVVFIMSASTSTTFANPTGTVGLAAVNGVLSTAMRSDAAPALNQGIAPTWTATHFFTGPNYIFGATAGLSVGNSSLVQQFGLTAQTGGHSIVKGTADTVGPRLNLGKTRSVLYDALTPVQSGDVLGQIAFFGADGTSLNSTGVQIVALTSAAVSTGVVPGELRIYVASTVGAQTERFRFSNFGGLGVAGGNYGTSGQVLTSGGPAAAPSWTTIAAGGAVAGSTTQIQYNNAGAFGASAKFTWDDSGGGKLTLGAAGLNAFITAASAAGSNAALLVRGATGTSNGAGGPLHLFGGDGFFGSATGNGGKVEVTGGSPGASGATPGPVNIKGGDSGGNSAGALVSIDGGLATGAGMTGGVVQISGGAGTSSAAGGAIIFRTGATTANRFFINADGSWGLAAAATVGISGQVLTSQGAAPPIWTTPSGGGSVANPTGLIGLTAVNGVATTALRSDGTHALDQGIAPTWTGVHTFTNTAGSGAIALTSASPALTFTETDVGANNKSWRIIANSQGLSFQSCDDTFAVVNNYLAVARASASVSGLTFGNATNNPTFTFAGTGVVTTGGVIRGPVGAVATPTYSFSGDTNTGIFHDSAGSVAVTCSGATITLTRAAGFIIGAGVIFNQDGSAATPAYNFLNDQDSGLYSFGANSVAISTGGTFRGLWDTTTHVLRLQLQGQNGTAALPGYGFENDSNSGMYSAAADIIGFSTGGVVAVAISTTYISSNVQGQFGNGTAALPSYSFSADPDNGMWLQTADTLGWATGGVNRMGLTSTGLTLTGSATATSFNATSSRAIKRETGAPRKAADILSRLRPLLYRLLDGDDREQLGLIAEEVRDVCPQLSDGKTVAYDRLAILLLAAWQEQNAVVA